MIEPKIIRLTSSLDDLEIHINFNYIVSMQRVTKLTGVSGIEFNRNCTKIQFLVGNVFVEETPEEIMKIKENRFVYKPPKE